MAFCKAERTLELATNYNPPPNFYQHQQKAEVDQEDVHATFAKEERFRKQGKGERYLPGPGHYHQPSKSSNKGYKIVAPKGPYSSENQIKINSIPSIPKQSTARAYEELAPGILILHEAEVEEGEIGPGSYDPKPVLKKSGVHKFSTTPYDRFEKKPEEQPRVYYSRPQQPKINMKEKLKQPEKKIINQSDLCLEMIILRQKQMKIDEVPPPGYYYNEKNVSGFNFQEKPKELQALAGKAKRFEEPNKESGLGPGEYTLVSVNKLSEGGFFAKANRNTNFGLETKDNPGPGAYIEEQKYQQQLLSTTKHPAIFSSGCVRFINTAKDQTPGPGQYNISRSKKQPKMRTVRMPLQTKTAKSFNSKQPIDDSFSSKYFSKDPFKPKTNTSMVKLRNQSSSFASRMKRFKDADTSLVGPGLYNVSHQARTKFNRKANILQQQQRFKYSQNMSEIGPGSYDVNDWVKSKKTHDIIFK